MKDSVNNFISSITDDKRRSDSQALLQLMEEATGVEPEMWGTSIVGFGTQHYKYASGREGDTMAVGFSPRKNALTLYGIVYYDHNIEKAKKLGPVTFGKGCLYVKDLAQINTSELKDLISSAFKVNNNTA